MPRIERSDETYQRVRHLTEWPMLILSVVFAIAFFLPMLVSLDGGAASTVETVVWLVWALFVFEYLVLFAVAADRRLMVRTHWLDLLIILLPFLRPLRLLRLLPLVMRAFVGVHHVTRRPGFRGFLVVAMGLVVAGAALVYGFERGHEDGTFAHFGDALWWGIVTATTVGYRDHAPVTAAGRGVAVVLMMVGIGLFSVVTASIAAYFVESDSASAEERDIAERLERIERLLEAQAGESAAGPLAPETS